MSRSISLLLFLILSVNTSFSQAPQKFKYQAIVRDSHGKEVKNQTISIRVAIVQNNPSGFELYSESHSPTTNNFGLVNILIGDGSVISGSMESIDWSSDDYFLKIGIDINGGSNYVLMGTSQLVSVPYALYAEKAGNVNNNDTSTTNEIQDLDLTKSNMLRITENINATYIDLNPFYDNTDSQYLTVFGDTLYISNGNQVILNDDVIDPDADPTNEIQIITFKNDTLYLSNGGYIYLGDYDNRQAMASILARIVMDSTYLRGLIVTNTSDITTHLAADGDLDSLNEIQNLAISNDTIHLSLSNSVKLPNYTMIIDDDNDTKISVETPSDDDKIKFFNKGINYIVFDSGRINILNNGQSVFIGQYAGYNDDLSDNKNVFIGFEAGRRNTVGDSNVAIGHSALSTNTSGSYNTAAGMSSLRSNSTGFNNTAYGVSSLNFNTSGVNNTAVGHQALFRNDSGYYNSAFGYKSLFSNIYGLYNTAIGLRALYNNSNGISNVGVGHYALYNNTTGSYNVAEGNNALAYNQTGSYNTAVGHNSGAQNPYTNLSNTSAFGFNAHPTANNRVNIGNTSIIWIGGQTNWSTYSDARFKKNVKEDVHGLDFILRLRPVTYSW